MLTNSISYQNSGYFSRLIVDYLDEKETIKSLYNRFPKLDHFLPQLQEKSKTYSIDTRKTLVEVLIQQNTHVELSEKTLLNIQSLNNTNAFTITTGHQLNLFTGPLYFIYKIVSTINLCKQLQQEYPEYQFVPVYWMATEDHDFEEINYFNYKKEKISWNIHPKGPVGRISTQSLQEVFEKIKTVLGNSHNSHQLKILFEKAYLEHTNLAHATRYLVNELFKKEGLVIIDGDDKTLKKLFVPYVKEELKQQTSYHSVQDTLSTFPYAAQVNPREINLFYIDYDLRERIIKEKEHYKINNTSLIFSEEEFIKLVENTPEKISPNVILRPLYQEIVLPNLCYIGGGGEIAYWLELKKMFQDFKVAFPILLVRNSVLLVSHKQYKKTLKLGLSWQDLFTKQDELIVSKTKSISQFSIDFSEQKQILQDQFEKLQVIARQTDKSFIGAVKAQEVKQIKGLQNLEKRLLKAEKKVHQTVLNQIINLQNELFPNQSLQERQLNLIELYEEMGDKFIHLLLKELTPLSPHFSVLTY